MKVYFDNAATTKPINNAEKLLCEHIKNGWYNPSAMYPEAVRAENDYKKSAEILCNAIGAKHVFFTSGGSESINTAIFKGYRAKGSKKLHFITSAYEHPAGDEPFKVLSSLGHEVDFIKPTAEGFITAEQISQLIRQDTALVSIMHVNNETGAVNDVVSIANEVKRINPQTVVHSDGVQGFLKCPINFENSALDYYSVSAHKVHGLKGTGALFYKKNAPISPYIIGGGQENGLRSGTQNTFGAKIFAQAVEEFSANHEQRVYKMLSVRETMLCGLKEFENLHILSPSENFAPHILYVAFENVRGEVILHLLETKGICISTGSACSSKKGTSRIATALSLKKQVADGVIRLSFSHDNTVEEAAFVLTEIKNALKYTNGFIRR